MKQSQPKKADLGKFERNTVTLRHKTDFSTQNRFFYTKPNLAATPKCHEAAEIQALKTRPLRGQAD